MALLDRDGCRSRMWGSNCWKEWMAVVDLSEDGVCLDDVYIAEVDVDVDDGVDAERVILCEPCDEETSEPDNHALEVSVAGSALFTDGDRRLGHAEQDHQSWGCPGESKHLESENIDDEFTPEVVKHACSNYARFSGIPREAVTAKLILERAPSLGIDGWADNYLEIRDNVLIQSERRMRERQERSLAGSGDSNCDDIQTQNVQIVKLIAALGAKDNGRRTILKAMAAKQSIDSQIAEDIIDGISDRRIHPRPFIPEEYAAGHRAWGSYGAIELI